MDLTFFFYDDIYLQTSKENNLMTRTFLVSSEQWRIWGATGGGSCPSFTELKQVWRSFWKCCALLEELTFDIYVEE